MSSSITTPAVGFSELQVEGFSGIPAHELRALQPDGFGIPGHWYPNKQGVMIYTCRGLEIMGYALENAGKQAAAVSLRAELKKWVETPARSLIPPSNRHKEPYYRRGQME